MKKWIGLLGLCAWTAQAEVTLAPAFSDYMVLQRGAVAPVWGTAKPGEKVTVEFAGQTKRTVAGEDGRWRVRLDAINDTTVTGGLKVTGENILLIKGVLDTINLLPVVPGLLELLGLVVVGSWSWNNLRTSTKREELVQSITKLRQEYLG